MISVAPFYFFLFFSAQLNREKCVTKSLWTPSNSHTVIALAKASSFAHNFPLRIRFAYRKQCFVDKHQQSCAGADKKQQFPSVPAQGDFHSLPRSPHGKVFPLFSSSHRQRTGEATESRQLGNVLRSKWSLRLVTVVKVNLCRKKEKKKEYQRKIVRFPFSNLILNQQLFFSWRKE